MKEKQLKLNPLHQQVKSRQLPLVNAREQQRKARDVKTKQPTLMDDVIYTNNL